MNRTRDFRNFPFLLTLIVNILLFIAVFFLMNYVQYLLNADAKINLTEIVTQNKDVITSKLMVEVNNLQLVSKQLSERFLKENISDEESMKNIFLEYSKDTGESYMSWASKDGNTVFPDGSVIDISGRQYFRRAMRGMPNISERTVSRLTGDDVFVISVPLQYRGEIIGTVQQQYTPQDFYSLCMVSLFSEQGAMYIINSQGYILISSEQVQPNRELDNYYRMLFLDNPEQSRKLEEDIQNNRAGFMETALDGKTFFSAYTPVDQIYDWYLISSVSTNAVSPNAAIVIQLFYFVLLAVVLFFAVLLSYSQWLKKRQRARLERIAFVDTVTGGNTYTKFTLDIEQLLAANPSQQFYIFTFDIDNFKYINNFYGFDTGDRLLKEIYHIYEQKLQPNERIARVSSDHFVLLLEAMQGACLTDFFQSEIVIEDITVYLSAGLYQIPSTKESINLMVDKANLAAQKIKGLRNKQVAVYLEEYDRQMIYNEQLKRALEQALSDGEIIPFFQPKVNILDRTLVGAEALARWRNKEGKLVPPGDFIPLCEQTGLIIQLDMAIFEQTLRFIRTNLDAGVNCTPISVNFSRMHLLNDAFLNLLLAKLEQYCVPHNLIEIELTETVIFDNSQSIAEFIGRLHDKGLTISMDDFGSGYSSLHMLKDVPIDVLKIDRGFLADTINSERQKAVFEAIAGMAQRLKIHVVVEGVENLDNIALMKEFGCTVAQGFYFSRPLDRPDFEKIYREGKL